MTWVQQNVNGACVLALVAGMLGLYVVVGVRAFVRYVVRTTQRQDGAA